MRLLVNTGIVILGLGAFALPRGASLTSFPAWMGGAALLLGVAVIVAMTRKRT